MNIYELHGKLQEAYTLKNLNNISLTLINLYKNQQYSILQKIVEIISDYVTIEITANGKGFSKLIKLYHPDRIQYYNSEIERLTLQNNYDGLLELSHILKLERIEEIANSLDSFEDIDYSPVYEWDINTEGFNIIKDDENEEKELKRSKRGYDFYDAIKLRQYGHTNVEFPSYYLEDIHEFELSSMDINDLEGVQFCIHAITLDLSNNKIADLSPLVELTLLEELNISDNLVENIDILSNLTHLKRVNLSNNCLKDIASLFELVNLEYADLSGNQICIEQINELVELGVSVDN
jgi:hypothetical protein